MRIIHTADWQIGKVFRRLGDKEALFREARLQAIEAIGRLAVTEGARHVLVAGDVYDTETPLRPTLLAPIERMRRFANVTWHLLPGNHDPHRAKGLWEQLAGLELPTNIRPHLAPIPLEIEPGIFLLPAPLTRRSEPSDLTAWMDAAETPPGAVRIGLAHGAITGFAGEGEAGNPIDPARPTKAGLAYLALGDWHRTMAAGERLWYAGTPEPDRMGGQEVGQALVVEIAGASPPRVTPKIVGRHRWVTRTLGLGADAGAVDDLERALQAEPELSCTVLRLVVTGHAGMAERTRLEAALPRIEAMVCHLDADLDGLRTRPSAADMEAIDFDGVLRRAAGRLQDRLALPGLSAAERRVAEEALVRLYLAGTAAG